MQPVSSYRIVETQGRIYVQKQWRLAWWSGWGSVKDYTGGVPYARDFFTLEIAKEYINNQLAIEVVCSQKPIITPYP